MARALWTILVKGALVPTTNYFDDLVLLALNGDRSSCSYALGEVMKLLGWKLSEDKTTEWNTSFEALGVLFKIDQTGSGVLRVKNTEKRQKELTSSIFGFLDSGMMTQKRSLAVEGQVTICPSPVLRKVGQTLSERSYETRVLWKIKAVNFCQRASGRVRQVPECGPTKVGGSSLVQDLYDSY